MIDELLIQGLGVIESASLRLAPGLTVVTGETGAGKTMLVTALELLLGARADSDLVRAGSPAAYAEARVRPAPPAAEEWLSDGEDELIVSREIPADGRSRARINGRLAPIGALAEVLGSTVEVHAQHEHVRLARPAVQRELLDRFAGEPHGRTLDAYTEAYDRLRAAERQRDQLVSDERERARTVERLRFEIDEIERAGLDPERDSRLEQDLAVLEHAEQLREATARASQAMGSAGAGEPIGIAYDAVRRLDVADDRLDRLRERLLVLAEEASDLAADLRDYGETIDADPAALDELRERRQLISGLCRKYGDDVEEVLTYAERAHAELEALEQQEAEASDLETRIDELERTCDGLADDLTRGRRTAAEALAATVEQHLVDLAMPHASLSVAVEPDGELGPHGRDRVEFMLAANPGEPARPFATAASGGERSRVALAIEVALADVDDAGVLVFDEIDAGIGGETAMAVGEKLARLSRSARPGTDGRQVLCVTHLAQLAAFADVHHVVEKGVRRGRTVTTTRQVAEDERVGELSRMLGGDAARTAGIDHARELLAVARERRAG